MPTTEELLKQAQNLNEAKEYDKVIALLTDEVLQEHKSAELFAEVAQACYRSNHKDLSLKYADFALSINSMHAKANFYKGVWLKENKDYEKAIAAYQRAIIGNPAFSYAYNGLGNVYTDLKKYDDAIEAYKKAIEIDPGFSIPYNGLGSVYRNLKKYVKAIDAYNKAIQIDPKRSSHYYNLANAYINLKKYEKAIEGYNKAIELNPENSYAYYNRALVYYSSKKYEDSRNDYAQYIERTKNMSDVYVQIAIRRIEEIKKMLDSPDYKNVSELVNEIKELLLHKEGCLTHYTGFSTAQKLVLEKSQFRLSEGAFLNDTAEGRELFDYLDFNMAISKNLRDTEAKPFAEKPFIGSFVAETKHDDLALWRMYGKENKEEAKGCAITIDAEGLIKAIREKIIPSDKMGPNNNDEELKFYRVAYRNPDNIFFIPGAKEDERALNKHMDTLKSQVKKFNKKVKEGKDKEVRFKDVLELLNSIAFLFKSAEYQYEHELRLVVKKGIGFDKNIEYKDGLLKVFIELVDITPHIRKITLGPKVEQRDEWAAIFYYTLEKAGFKPDIYISHLPFK